MIDITISLYNEDVEPFIRSLDASINFLQVWVTKKDPSRASLLQSLRRTRDSIEEQKYKYLGIKRED
ncbi:hypothetical protein LCGC14_2451310 [marine sediment metagenome]|uniref:Uncharacterized protein n=1 Tax=marine sediment metagenome TaxID=412755 RepID=A0A0F9DT55_9ZZZZ